MTEKQQESKEEQILRAVKRTLTEVIKDTATEPGLRHPLSESTITGLRDCLILISQREQELGVSANREMGMRPRFKDTPRSQGEVVVPINSITRTRKQDD